MIENLDNIKAEAEEIQTLLYIVCENYFSKQIDPSSLENFGTYSLLASYEEYTLLSSIARDKANALVEEINKIYKELKEN
ncbi:hypothetical protein HZY83_02445 [Gemella sp. GH3]|uniref:hypothetical protein n=1 Tax=unclassified Gemella TaxID=2624949 RepID=UPI0015D079D0|nr:MULTISPECIES: hypothetical protein [unclassified Gemella]MBF0713546.1 hypothetical protein [Gemella sp. GH3.1]NYS50498.1 hypothetical protein [Gemella sp. GH3]